MLLEPRRYWSSWIGVKRGPKTGREANCVRLQQECLPRGDKRKLALLAMDYHRMPLSQLWSHLPKENRQRLGLVVARMVARAITSREGGPSHDR